MNKRVNTLFFELVRSAIWNNSADESLFHDLDSSLWLEIIGIAESQKVNALLYDGIMTLPTIFRPEKKILYKLFLQTEAIEKSNEELSSVLKILTLGYDKIDCPFILLKGQGNALLYPNPKHRTPGDIDVFFYRKGDYEKANQWAVEKGYDLEPENIHHQSFNIDNVHIENHLYVTYFGIKKYDNLLRKTVDQIIENNDFEIVNINDRPIKLLPAEFNAFFIFQHMFHHFIHLGVGMRQFCDWILFLSKNKEKINKDSFTKLATSFDLLRPMQVFAKTAIKYLHAPEDIFPFELISEDKYADIVMEEIIDGGNFGFYTFENKKYKGKWHGKWDRFVYSTKRTLKIAPISPEHIRFLPFIKIATNLKLLSKEN